MNVCTDRTSMHALLEEARLSNQMIGFVPTMGALHEGHLALVQKAMEETPVVVVSIFVNPTQFNNPSDLEAYPRTVESDLAALSKFPNCILFIPSVDEIYPETDDFRPMDLGLLDQVMEGANRPGHFAGVVHVVHNLFRIIRPNKAFFGKKDYQQLAVIRLMTASYNLPVQIVACDTVRNASGLALSSRNMRLSATELEESLVLYKTLLKVQEWSTSLSPSETKLKAEEYFSHATLRLEYIEISDAASLAPLSTHWTLTAVCCIAAWCGDVRLIDNLEIVQ